MNLAEPMIAGSGRFRVHRVRSGFHVAFQVEWQRNYKSLRRMRLETKDGAVLEFFSPPPWESCMRLFDNETSAARFAIAVLEASPCTDAAPGGSCGG